MPAFDAFTLHRVVKFIDDFRRSTGNYPTLRDLEEKGFEKTLLDSTVKAKKIEEVYVTLTTGAVVKGYKASSI